jgi:CHAD domain-containing protein
VGADIHDLLGVVLAGLEAQDLQDGLGALGGLREVEVLEEARREQLGVVHLMIYSNRWLQKLTYNPSILSLHITKIIYKHPNYTS